MRETRRRCAERAVELHVLGRIGKMILAANDVRDLHLDVVHDVDEMENPRAVGPADGHVRIRLGAGHVEFDVAADDVIDDDLFARETKADGTRVVVNAAGGAEFVEITLIDRFPLALKIRAKIPAGFRAFIPIESKPAQPVVNGARGLLGVARPIGIFDAQNQRAARVFGVEPVEQGRARAAYVEIAGGRWSKADANGGRHGSAF